MQNEIVQTVGSVPYTEIQEYSFLRPFHSTPKENRNPADDLWSVGENIVLSSETANKEKERIERSLYSTFDSEPLEDGMDHPSEDVLVDALEAIDERKLLSWLKEFSLDSERPAFSASILRCLGRMPELGTEEWRVDLVRSALTMRNVQIRDAAVQAAEHWADHGFIEVLQDHTDTEQWITDYINMVIDDMTS